MGAPEEDLEAASVFSSLRQANFPAELTCELPADGEPEPESFVAITLIVSHLIKFVEQMRRMPVWHPGSRVFN